MNSPLPPPKVVDQVRPYMNGRLTPEELRTFEGYKDVTDEEAEVILDDLLAFARMCLDLVG